MRARKLATRSLLILLLIGLPSSVLGQSNGVVRGTITGQDKGTPLHNVIVTIVELKRSVETDQNGLYEFQQVPPGSYTILAHIEGFPDEVETVKVTAGGTATFSSEWQDPKNKLP